MIRSYTIGCSHIQSVSFEKNLPFNFFLATEAHIWLTDIAHWDSFTEKFENILSRDELLKAKRFLFKKDYDLYLISHGILRVILSLYTGIAPEKLVFEVAAQGKPYIFESTTQCYFSLAHSGHMMAISINSMDETGIDIEEMISDFSWQDIAEDYFSAKELKNLKKLDQIDSLKLFYTYWTRKEAYLKAIGLGLIDDITHIEVISGINEIKFNEKQDVVTNNQNWQVASFFYRNKYISSFAFSPAVTQKRFFKAELLLTKTAIPTLLR